MYSVDNLVFKKIFIGNDNPLLRMVIGLGIGILGYLFLEIFVHIFPKLANLIDVDLEQKVKDKLQ